MVPTPTPQGRPTGPLRILLDANALLLPFTRRFPLEREIHRLVEGARVEVPSSVLGEIHRLAEKGLFPARAAESFARRFPIVKTDLRGDAALEALAQSLGAWVVTGDRQLRSRLEGLGIVVLYPRGTTHLEVSAKTAVTPRPPPPTSS